MIVGVDKDLEMVPKLVVAIVMVALDGGVLDGAVHSLDLAIGPRMVGLGQAVLDAVLAADLVEAMDSVARGTSVPVAREVGELDAIVGKDGVEVVGHRFEQRFQEQDRGQPICLFMKLNKGELIPRFTDQNSWAQFRNPIDMIFQGWSTSLFQASQQ